MKNVVLYKKIPLAQKKRLQEQFNLTAFDKIDNSNSLDFINVLKTADGLIGASVPFNADLLSQAPNLKAISTISVGYDNFDVNFLNQHGIRLMHTPNVLTDTTADTIFTLILTTARRAVELSNMIYRGEWKHSIPEEFYGVDVHHKTLGILGMGRIGQAVAKRAYCGFDMKILYMSNKPNPQAEEAYQAKYCTLDDLLQNSDFVCITLPLNPSTKNLISKEKIALMKPSAILINAARGKIVDQNVLIEALQNRRILAAGLDVFEVEPLPMNSPLLHLKNIVLLPHIGSATVETREKMVECAVDNLIAALNPEKPSQNWVNPEVG